MKDAVTATGASVDLPSEPGPASLSLMWLSLGAGCTDVLSFLKLGDVFTSAMTGNTALLAIAIGRGTFPAASRSLCALVAFTLGVALATLVYAPWGTGQNGRRAFRRLLLVELLFLSGCAALWSAGPDPLTTGALYLVIGLSALSMGIQAVGARTVGGSAGITTVVFTTALIRIVMAATAALVRPAAAVASPMGVGAHLGTFGAYVGGAALAAILVSHYFGALIWIPVAAVVLALASSELADRAGRSTR